MKHPLFRIISLFLIVALLMPIGISASESTTMTDGIVTYPIESTQMQTAQEIYNGLTPAARQLFDQIIASNSDLLDYHREHVDSTFTPSQYETTAVTSSELTTLSNLLAQLNLPTSVVYSLEAMGSGLAASIVDGPLPIGEILLAAGTAMVVITVAENWSEVRPKWSSIISAFKTAFSTMTSNISDAFDEIEAEVPNAQNACVVQRTGKSANIDGIIYAGTKSISDIKKSDVGSNKYYVAILYAGDVWVALSNPISKAGFAKYILAANHPQVGIFATTKTYARGLAGNYPYGPERHDRGSDYESYYWHYHNNLYPHAHIWYPNIALS